MAQFSSATAYPRCMLNPPRNGIPLFSVSVTRTQTLFYIASSPVLVGPGGREVALSDPDGDNIFTSDRPLDSGVWLTACVYQPLYFGSSGNSLTIARDPTVLASLPHAQQFIYAKGIYTINGGGGAANPAVTRPVGHPFELVPVTDPTRLKLGDTLEINVVRSYAPFAYYGNAEVHIHEGRSRKEIDSHTQARHTFPEAINNGHMHLFIERYGLYSITAHILPRNPDLGDPEIENSIGFTLNFFAFGDPSTTTTAAEPPADETATQTAANIDEHLDFFDQTAATW
ncbi:MAG: DUF4198 domain-containing protein [Methylobacteriaceae bacterium]|nr:DUF4198 domain-containing protein [Methylobacteriaceae bacterium]